MKNKIIGVLLFIVALALAIFAFLKIKSTPPKNSMDVFTNKELYHLDAVSEKNPSEFTDDALKLVDEFLENDIPYYTHSSFMQMYKNGVLEPRQTFFSKDMYELVTPEIENGEGLENYFDFDYESDEAIPVLIGSNFSYYFETGKTYEDSLFGHIVKVKIVGTTAPKQSYPDLLENMNYFDSGILYPVNKSLFKKYVDSPQDVDMMFNRTLFKNPESVNLFSDKMSADENGICDLNWVKIDEKIENWKNGYIKSRYNSAYIKIAISVLLLIVSVYVFRKK